VPTAAAPATQRPSRRGRAVRRGAPWAWLLILLAAGFAAAPASAQESGATSADPAQVHKRFEAPVTERPAAAPVAVPEREAVPAVAEDVSFVLSGVTVSGASVYALEDFIPLYTDYLGQTVGIAEIEAILAAIADKYRSDGFILAQASAPAQSLAFGILKVVVAEGFIERVSFEGALSGEEPLLKAYGNKLASARPLRLSQLERYLSLMNDLPGLDVEASVRVLDAEAGAHELQLATTQRSIEGFAQLDNRGTRPVGRFELGARVAANSVLGAFERSELSIYTNPVEPRELVFVQAYEEVPLNAEGTSAFLVASRGWIDAGAELAAFDTESRGSYLRLGLSHPVLRATRRSLYLAALFDYEASSEKQFGQEIFDDRLSVARLRGRYFFSDSIGGANFASLEASRGLDALNASPEDAPNRSRFAGESEFTKLSAELTRQQELGQGFAVSLSAAGQISADPLLSAEEFRVGGWTYGRAFDPSQITGEDGAAFVIEVQQGAVLDGPGLTSYQVYGFYDLGAVWNTTRFDGRNRSALSSTGVGTRLGFFDNIHAGVEIGVPLHADLRDPDDEPDGARAYFYLNAAF